MSQHPSPWSTSSYAHTGGLLRLDRLPNPHGPVEGVMDALLDSGSWQTGSEERLDLLRVRLAARIGVSSDWIVLANGIDELHAMIATWRNQHGPLVTFTPTDPALVGWLRTHADQLELVPRARGFSLSLESKSGLPHGSTVIIMSPNDPTGTVLNVQDAVRLSRQASLVVIDQRHAAYSPRTLMPLVREFENLVLVDSFENFASLTAAPLAWAIAPPRLAKMIERFGRPSGISPMALAAGLAAIDHDEEIRQTVRQVMVEKGRLYRQLRKLSMISVPYPSWANFLLTRFERGSSGFFLPRLQERGILLHEVRETRLRNHVRVSAVSADATNTLKQALIEIALELP